MCLILLAYRTHPEYRLILAANRDEFFARPTEALAFWPDEPEILAGRDLQAGGTWFGLSPDGRFAAVTNFRDPQSNRPDALSRGRIPIDYLKSGLTADTFCKTANTSWHNYNGFNLIVEDRQQLIYASNRTSGIRILEPGLYGLSNHLLDTPWPKVERGKNRLHRLLAAMNPVDHEEIFSLLSDSWQPPEDALPDTGIGQEWERLLAPIFISGREYGTRSSLVLTIRYNGETQCSERTYLHDQGAVQESGRRVVHLEL